MTHGHMWTKDRLVEFEDRVAAAFEAKQVRGPIHLCSDGQAGPLLNYFATGNVSGRGDRPVKPEDWKLGTWRGHWVALLSGVPEDEVFDAICAGRSMFLNFAEQRVLCSAIVGGIVPIVVGLAMGIKRNGERSRVHCFVGDMTARTGLFFEAAEYARRHDLPVRWVIEDNGLSTNANTFDVWGSEWATEPQIQGYKYERNRPHTGTGKHVTF